MKIQNPIGLKILLFIFLFFFFQKAGAVSFIFETEKDYLLKREFNIKIKIDPKEKVINAINFELSFNAEFLEFVGFNRENSIISLWIEEPEIIEKKISFSGGIPNGFRGIFIGTPLEANELIEIKFKKKKEISREEIEKGFILRSEIFMNNESGESLEIKDFSFREENIFEEGFNILSGILYNGIMWKVEKVF